MPHSDSDHLAGTGTSESQLERLLAVSKRLATSADLNSVLRVVIDALRDLLGCERATVFVLDPEDNALVAHTAHGLSEGTLRIPLSVGIAGACARTRRIIWVPDVQADARFDASSDATTGFETRNTLALPLIDEEGQVIGVAQLLNKAQAVFDAEDQTLAIGLAAHAALALKRARLIEDRIVRASMEQELAVARTIQQAATPARALLLDAYTFVAHTIPAYACGGDAVDFGLLSQGRIPSSDAVTQHDGAFFFVADAAGHGVGPALQATATRAMLRAALRLTNDLRVAVAIINEQLVLDAPSGRFVTAWFGILDAKRGTVTCLSAGQSPILIYRAASKSFESRAADTVPLGITTEGFASVALCHLQLERGDALVVGSDGYFEARSSSDEVFGEARVIQVLEQGFGAGLTLDQIAAELDAETLRFVGSDSTEDDRAVFIAQRNV